MRRAAVFAIHRACGACVPVLVALCILCSPASYVAAETATRTVQWDAVGNAVLQAAQREMANHEPPSIAIGLVNRDGLAWFGAAGHADAQHVRAPDARTLYRVASITKLLTDVIAMQFVERGLLDLDAPVQRYLRDFNPRNPYPSPITLRHLMSHRSGLVREPPVGSYFAMQPATLADTVRSLDSTTLVAEPGTLTKYSNAGVAVIGRILEVVSGRAFEELMQGALLEPLGMQDTALTASAGVLARLAHSQFAPFDASRFAAPVFDLGIAPAAAAYTNVADLSKFAAALLRGGASPRNRVLGKSTLEKMWQRQPDAGSQERFGLGFSLGSLDGHRLVGHTGAMYGHASELTLFPDDGFAVIVFAALDEAHPLVRRLRTYASRQVLAALSGQPAPEYAASTPVSQDDALAVAGHYANGTRGLDVRLVGGKVWLEAPGTAAQLRRLGRGWVLDDVTTYREDIRVDPHAGTISLGDETYRRQAWTRPAPPPEELAGLIGDYGWEHNYLRVYERDGEPYVRIEWSHHEPLERVGPDVYRFGRDSMYALERLRFERDSNKRGRSVSLNGLVFARREFGAETQAHIRSVVRETPDLRARALAASAPVEKNMRAPELVDVERIEPGLRLDVRYASDDNFMGIRFYDSERAFLQRPAAQSLARAHRALAEQGYGILVHDAYRPWYVTKMFWEATPPAARSFVADPSQGSRHNRGSAADITLFELESGRAAQMPGEYDEMSARSSPLYLGGTSLQRWHRDLLKQALETQGFSVYTYEWWHFDHHGWHEYPILNLRFEQIGR